MRYFIAKNGSTVVDKQASGGDDAKIDAAVTAYRQSHPTLIVTEVDVATFDGTTCQVQQTQTQKDWAILKASGPTALQIATFFAKFLGLE